MSAGSTSATRPSGTGGTGSARCSPRRSAGSGCRRCDSIPTGKWHLDEVYVKINGEMHYLWRAVDQEGEVLESYVTKTRDKAAALTFIKRGAQAPWLTQGDHHRWVALLQGGHEGDRQRAISRRSAAGPTTAVRTHTSRSGDENGPCCGSGR